MIGVQMMAEHECKENIHSDVVKIVSGKVL
jgi:hypothetical protein